MIYLVQVDAPERQLLLAPFNSTYEAMILLFNCFVSNKLLCVEYYPDYISLFYLVT